MTADELIAKARDAMIARYASSPGSEWNWHDMATIALTVFEEKDAPFSPPDGWFIFGSHAPYPWIGRMEFSEAKDEAGMPLWERPVAPTDDEREALWDAFDKMHRVTEGGCDTRGEDVADMVLGLDFRRPVSPEPSIKINEGAPIPYVGPGPEFMVQVDQGDDYPDAEGLAALREQGEQTDALTVQFFARRGGKSQALIDSMLAQANDQGIRVEVVYPQTEQTDAAERRMRDEFEYRIRTAVAYGAMKGYREIPVQVRADWIQNEISKAMSHARAHGLIAAAETTKSENGSER